MWEVADYVERKEEKWTGKVEERRNDFREGKETSVRVVKIVKRR